jgi:hypothetical protein
MNCRLTFSPHNCYHSNSEFSVKWEFLVTLGPKLDVTPCGLVGMYRRFRETLCPSSDCDVEISRFIRTICNYHNIILKSQSTVTFNTIYLFFMLNHSLFCCFVSSLLSFHNSSFFLTYQFYVILFYFSAFFVWILRSTPSGSCGLRTYVHNCCLFLVSQFF